MAVGKAFHQQKEMTMYKRFVIVALASTVFAGCATVPMDGSEASSTAKSFAKPSAGNAGLYVYRSGIFGSALKKDIWVDGNCLGESAPNVFFYQEVKGDTEHKVSTESEFSANDVVVKTESGKNYFVSQYMKFGVFVGGAGLELVDEEKGKAEIKDLEMAQKGNCSQ